MNKTRKAICCTAILLFCTLASLQAQESYLSQADIHAFIANYDDLMDENIFDNLDDSAIGETSTAKEFTAILGKEKWIIAKSLQKYGMNANHPVETFYTIGVGTLVLRFEAAIEITALQADTEEMRQMLRDEMLNSSEFTGLTEVRNSIHPDDLRLLITNFRFLNVLMDGEY